MYFAEVRKRLHGSTAGGDHERLVQAPADSWQPAGAAYQAEFRVRHSPGRQILPGRAEVGVMETPDG